MEGSLASPELYGVIPRSAQAIFEHLKQPQYKEQVVTCSYLEIYNEELRDLLLDNHGGSGTNGGGVGSSSASHHQQHKLDIMEGKNGTFCRWVNSIECIDIVFIPLKLTSTSFGRPLAFPHQRTNREAGTLGIRRTPSNAEGAALSHDW